MYLKEKLMNNAGNLKVSEKAKLLTAYMQFFTFWAWDINWKSDLLQVYMLV